MRVRKVLGVGALAAVVVWIAPRTVSAGPQYQTSITQDIDAVPQSTTHLAGKEADKLVVKPSKKKGDGGASIQLVMKGVSCTNCNNNVLDLSVRALGQDLGSTAGILYNITGGTAVFPSTGKNK